jgi:type VI secretion system protein ImpB
VGDAIERKELPFVVGVLADLSGQPVEPLAPLKERKFVEITPDNFDAVLDKMTPRLAYTVDNELSDQPDAGQIKVDLRFTSMDDFAPERIAQNIEPLRQLLELRTKLSDLRGSLQGNAKLDDLLFDAITNTELRDKLRAELHTEGDR